MEIPESIDNLTTTTGSDPFNVKLEDQKINLNKLLDTLKYNIPLTDYSSVEEGLTFYKKDTQTDSVIIKNFLLLYLETLKKSVLTSNISDELKPLINRALNENINSMTHSLDTLSELIITLNKQKNILDANRISFIMLGYAINIIKKIYNA
jgi:hypothetical protein